MLSIQPKELEGKSELETVAYLLGKALGALGKEEDKTQELQQRIDGTPVREAYHLLSALYVVLSGGTLADGEAKKVAWEAAEQVEAWLRYNYKHLAHTGIYPVLFHDGDPVSQI